MEAPRILQVDPDDPDPAVLKEAADVLIRGGLLILPTETVYGLAANAEMHTAVERIHAVKGRARDKPLALLAPNVEGVVNRGAQLGLVGRKLADAFWPGPLTLVTEGPEGWTGYRVPDHAVPLRLMDLLPGEGLMATTSANASGKPNTLNATDAAVSLEGAVDLVLDGGPVTGGVSSTVVRVIGEGLEILREGALTAEMIYDTTGIGR